MLRDHSVWRAYLMPLRFGIEAVGFESALNRLFIDDVIDFSRFDIVDIVREEVEQGYQVIEMPMDLTSTIPEALTPESITRLAELKDEFGHAYTAHLPLWSIELATFNEHVRRGSVESVVESVKLAESLDPEFYVLHATGSLAAEFSRQSLPEEMTSTVGAFMNIFSATSVEEIISKSEIDPQRLAIENIEFPFELTREIVDEYDMGICFDTAHLLARYSGDESLVEFYHKHKDRIVELHLQDGTRVEKGGVVVTKDHLPLGRGEMKIREFLLELVNDNFNGPVIFELSLEEAKESMDKIRELVPEALE